LDDGFGTLHADLFGYEYFDDPTGMGYRGYHRESNGDGYLPWPAAVGFCRSRAVRTAIEVGCAKGYLVDALLLAGICAVGCDVSDYALSFTSGLPCMKHDIRFPLPFAPAEAVFALGVLCYLGESEVAPAIANLRYSSTRYVIASGYYAGDPQEVEDPLRRTTKSWTWWHAQFASEGLRLEDRMEYFDVYIKS
jgi:hypothetical protein